MNKKHLAVLFIFVVISSFLGGAMAQFIFGDSKATAKEKEKIFPVIKTHQLILVNKNGKIRASLSLENPGEKDERPTLNFYDREGNSRASFYLGGHDSPGLILYDQNGTNRFHLGLAPAGNAGISIRNGKFEKLLDLDTSSGIPMLSVRGQNTMIHWTAP